MKVYTLRFRSVDEENFEDLRKGIKSVETRAASPRYKSVEVGDKLVFVCDQRKFSRVVTRRSHFKSIEAMLRKIPFKKIMPDLKSKKEAKKRWASYPNYEKKIRKFGILAFELKK